MNPNSALRKIIGWVALIATVLIVVAWGCSQRDKRKTAEKQEEVSSAQGGASLDAAAEAMNTSANIASQAQEHDRIKQEGQDAVRAAPEGKKGQAAIRGMCAQRAYRDHPDCQEPGR